MNTFKSRIKTILSSVALAGTFATALPALGQGTAQINKTAGPAVGQGTVQVNKAASPILCYLALRGSTRYSGPCTISAKTDGVRIWYTVDMINFGTTFVRQGEGLYANEINGGSFKAVPVSRNGSLIINWNFNNLVLSRDCSSGCKVSLDGSSPSVSVIMDSFFGFRSKG
jgi:hypothetical protein